MFRKCLYVGALVCIAGPALASLQDANGYKVNPRVFNDYPGSNLSIVTAYPNATITEQQYGAGGWANRHDLVLSTDGGTTGYQIPVLEGFDISVNIMLDAGSIAPRKEAGIRFNGTGPHAGNDGLFILTSDGEVAAFGASLPFHTFGNSAYALGSTVTMRMIYRPSVFPGESTMEYLLNGNSSGQKAFNPIDNGLLPNSELAFYGQFAVDDSNPQEFGFLQVSGVQIAAPEPASALLLIAGLVALRRR
ncbi:hypothetical protein RAS1_35260 [Phycisphaerae bacterium RAS1]|nr:hypothetical protein RAS1_35260 [Phycisphaerae bacterium RAS1]